MFPGFSTVGRQAWEVVGQEQLFIAGDVISLHLLRAWNIHRGRDWRDSDIYSSGKQFTLTGIFVELLSAGLTDLLEIQA